MTAKWFDLRTVLDRGIVPESNAFLVTVRFHSQSRYAIFEITRFEDIKSITPVESGLEIHGGGFRVYVVFEPPTYALRFQEPYLREDAEKIPCRFDDLTIVELPGHERILISKKLEMNLGSHSVSAPSLEFFYYFPSGPESVEHVCKFFSATLQKDFQIRKTQADTVLVSLRPHIEALDQGSGIRGA